VQAGGVVRADLLADDDRRDHWRVVWQTWLGGYDAGRATSRPAPRRRAAWEDTPAGPLHASRNE
jgi:hypothetical protein